MNLFQNHVANKLHILLENQNSNLSLRLYFIVPLGTLIYANLHAASELLHFQALISSINLISKNFRTFSEILILFRRQEVQLIFIFLLLLAIYVIVVHKRYNVIVGQAKGIFKENRYNLKKYYLQVRVDVIID